uniref:Uncharacterized protein n=1 Tax=Rhizophora mucronata TaxID=61149 RepID=A0A2P2R2N3_RHIMU
MFSSMGYLVIAFRYLFLNLVKLQHIISRIMEIDSPRQHHKYKPPTKIKNFSNKSLKIVTHQNINFPQKEN